MEEAKSAIKKFTSHHGQHDTTVHEHHQPSVTHQHVTPTRHDEGTTVVDREVHQDHYHTNVQPIHDREVLPEEHRHKLLPTEQKEYQHGDPTALKQRLSGDAAKYRDATETGPTQYTKATKPEVTGEHVHHHIHETIQPVVQKETIQPTVVHTTKPVHEVHHNAAQHHTATVLPAMNLSDFKNEGGSLTGAKDRVTHYEGEPGQNGLIRDARQGSGHHHSGVVGGGPTGRVTNEESVLRHERPHEGHSGATVNTAGATAGAAGAAGALGQDRNRPLGDSRMDPRVDSRKEHAGRAGDLPIASEFTGRDGHPGGSAIDKDHVRHHDHGTTAGTRGEQPPTREFADTHIGAGESGNTTNAATYNSNFEAANIHHGGLPTEKKKPSLIDKLNPMKDADGDGKKGVMH